MPMDWFQILVTVLGFAVSGAMAVWRVSWIVSSGVSTMKAEFHAMLDMKEQEMENKIKRVYERFDDYKQRTDDTFIRKDMCGAMHTNTAISFNDIMRRLESLEKKLDTIVLREK